MLAVNRARIYQLTQRDDFPPPVAVLAMGSNWRLADVLTWAKAAGRTVHTDTLDQQSAGRQRPR